MVIALGISAAALLLASQASTDPGPWVLDCNMPAAGASGTRTFLMGPKLFQEWDEAQGKFGPNRCASYPCRSIGDRLEGEISSSSLVVTIRLNPASGRAEWRAVGASGLDANSGACSVRPHGQTPPA